MENRNIILFDGVCNLCNTSVQFFIKKDSNKELHFASLQSDFGQETLRSLGKDLQNFDSFIFLEKGKVYTKSSAGLRAISHLDGPLKLLSVFLIVPKVIRDFVYTAISKNRYKWFGKSESCLIPTPELKSRFL